jgi:hypothetical protein
MVYNVKVTATKPDESRWFRQDNLEKFDELNSWVMSLPGLVGTKKLIDQSTDNVVVKVFRFTDEAAYHNFISELDSSPLESERRAYNSANGIKITYQVI